MFCDSPHPPFGQTCERQDVSCTISEFGEEAHQSFGRLIRPSHQITSTSSHLSILCNHALASFDVSEMELLSIGTKEIRAIDHHRRKHRVSSRLDIYGNNTIRFDPGQRSLGIRLVGLNSIR